MRRRRRWPRRIRLHPHHGRRDLAAEGAAGYVLSVTDPRKAALEVARALVAAGSDVLSITESHHSLEDVYLQLIAEDPEAPRA